MIRRPPKSTLFPSRRSSDLGPLPFRDQNGGINKDFGFIFDPNHYDPLGEAKLVGGESPAGAGLGTIGAKKLIQDRKSTRLNSSHSQISYAVFCLKKKIKKKT